jgi:diguanylate cyclase (GGDEF)-like protein
LRQLDLHDSLTGLYNRNAIRLLAGMDEQFGVLTIEVDQLAKVRDRFGQGASDHVLQSVAATIVTSVRRRDATVRNGEEELLVLLDSADEKLTGAVAERIRLRITRLDFAAFPDVPPVTVSIGAAIHHRGQPVDEAIGDAGGWLREAKRDGRNRVNASWIEH